MSKVIGGLFVFRRVLPLEVRNFRVPRALRRSFYLAYPRTPVFFCLRRRSAYGRAICKRVTSGMSISREVGRAG